RVRLGEVSRIGSTSMTSEGSSGASCRTTSRLLRSPDPGGTVIWVREGSPSTMGKRHATAADSWENTGLRAAAAAVAIIFTKCWSSNESLRQVADSRYEPRRTL